MVFIHGFVGMADMDSKVVEWSISRTLAASHGSRNTSSLDVFSLLAKNDASF